MAESIGHDLVSKCVAIQYGLLVAGVILLLVASWSWYKNWSKPCLEDCKEAQSKCRAACDTPVAPPATTSRFASGPRRKGGKFTENMLAEGFLSYRSADEEWQDPTAVASPADEDPESGAYDPAQESLDQSVFDSHKEFVDESYETGSGSMVANVERDDTNEVVTRWGLRRVNYTDAYSSEDARTVSSEYPEQVAQGTGPTDDSGLF